MEDLNEVWSKTYYIKPVLLVCILIAFFIGIKFYKKEKSHLLFLIYALFSFITLLILDISTIKNGLSHKAHWVITETGNTILEISEFLIFFYYFLKILNIKLVKVLLKILVLPFITLTVFFFVKIFDPNFSQNQICAFSFKINVLEFFLLLFPCLIFFYNLFSKEASQTLRKSPSFWIITGIFFYCITSLPFLLVGDNLAFNNRELYDLMFAIHYTSLALLFLALAKAFQCKKSLTA